MSKSNGIATGIIMILIGLSFVVFPAFIGSMFSVFIGAGLCVAAVSGLIAWWNMRKVAPSGGILLFALVDMLLGVICLAHPLATAISLGWVVALCIAGSGILRIIFGISTPYITGVSMVASVLSGICSVIFGGLAIAMPELLIYFLGAGFIANGAGAIIVSLMAKPYEPIDIDPL